MNSLEESNRNSSLISKLHQIVHDNLNNEQFGVKDLSETYGLSRSQLHKKLKKKTGKSVSQFIREIRLEEAKKLLEQEDLTASEVAYQVGFSSATYFNTRFKDYFGYPPGEVKVRSSYEKNHPENHTNETTGESLSTNTTWKKWLLGAAIGLVLLIAGGVLLTGKKDGFEKIVEAVNEPLPLADTISNEKTIAVLPLKNWSGDPNLEYISDGMTDAIINKLAKIKAIDKVIPFTSVVQYKNNEKTIREIAKELGVSNVLQGSLQLSGEVVSVKLQMIDGEKQEIFWDNEYTEIWKSDELFQLQSEVAENVSNKINASATAEELKDLNNFPTANKEAYDLYLQGNYEWSKGTKLGYENARRLYNKTIELDSTFIGAYVNLSLVWIRGSGVWGYYDKEEAKVNISKYLLRAKNMAPENAKVMDLYLRTVFFDDWDFGTMENNYQKTLIAPLYLMYVGRYEEAEAYMQSAESLRKKDEPLYSQWYAEALFYNGKPKKALEIYNDHYEFYNDDYDWLRESTKYLYYLGEYQMARKRLDRLMRLFPDRPPIVIWLDAVISHSLGDQKKAEERFALLKKLEKMNNLGSTTWFIALYYCHKKEYDLAFQWLETSMQKNESELIWLHSEPLLRPVRDDQRYLKMHKTIGFPYPPLEPVTFP